MKAPHLDPDQLRDIETRTLRHYDGRSRQFWEGTRDHDVSQNRAALLRHIHNKPPLRILDLGCGGGRDLIAFRELGHEAIGLDGSAALCELARRHSGCEVWQQHFLHLDLPTAHFDGIFANASLFHVPTQELPRVLRHCRSALRDKGILFSSNPRGDNVEGWNGTRYGAYHDLENWSRLVGDAGFELLEYYYRPEGRPRHEQPWLATVWVKVEGTRSKVQEK